MPEDRKSILLRLPPELADELNRWAHDELRSVNAQIEYLLREAVHKRRSAKLNAAHPPAETPQQPPHTEPPAN